MIQIMKFFGAVGIFMAVRVDGWMAVSSPKILGGGNRHEEGFCQPFLRSDQASATPSKRSALFVYSNVDIDVVFGSGNETGVNWGHDDDDYDEEEREQNKRRQVVNDLLAEQDEEFRQMRKKKNWGKFANVTNREELKPLLEQARQAVAKENKAKADLAAASGVSMEILEPVDHEAYDETGNIKITSAADRQNSMRWYSSVDEELKSEWESLVAGDNDKERINNNFDQEEEDNDDDGPEDALQLGKGGKIINRNDLQGVRVGSAGGWMLEVFPGDFVVHRKFGIGRFEKTVLRSKSKLTPEEIQAQAQRRSEILTEKLREIQGGVTPEQIQEIRSKFGTEEDDDPVSNPQATALEITYADAVVHVPVDRAYRISRYRAGDSVVKPKLSKVKGQAWAKAKQKVEENTLQLAQDVLALYATRETLQRQSFDPSKESLITTFEATFPYDPTPDQKRCFEDVANDMVWRNRPMDRLVCGDVGFGKTEVAIRALYRTVVNGQQAALLAPTGVLAAQHYKNILKRMGPDTPYNVTVSLLRGGMGKNSKAGKEMREEIANGNIQLIVGTHAILSNDLKFHELGLLVVDEEQRFGVKQKERLKLICNGVDVLTLSATPIPRTLQMSLSGIRDTSTIRSPPPMRKPTITYVQEFGKDMVQAAIETELERGGQCYYVVPRISMLEDARELLVEIFPNLRIIEAHGRMQRNGAEANVALFAEGHYDVLLATTVIENGVDIPSVNTIIIQNSQAFGMSTLYQLRGRVGRSDRQAFAYFLHSQDSLTEQAAMRLQAIGELNELGSGFDVANRDLEIRGAGSLLGTEQSGMAAKVGFDLYMRMLKKSIRQLRGLDLPLVPRTNFLNLLPKGTAVEAFSIPETYIEDRKDRRSQETKARLAESSASLVELTERWKTEYGPIPATIQMQLKTSHLHACTRRLGIDLVGLVKNRDGTIDCVMRSPGFRPRHWATIVQLLPKGGAPKSLDVAFPARFTRSGEDQEIAGGKRVDLKALLTQENLSEDAEDEEWDAMDQEEIEAMKEISSAVSITSMNDVDIQDYPRFILRNISSKSKKVLVDNLLKVLLPVAKIVYEKQENDKDAAKVAAELRDKQAALRARKKISEKMDLQRLGSDSPSNPYVSGLLN